MQVDAFNQQQMLQPILLEQAGIKTLTDESGAVIGYEAIPDPLDPMRDEIQQLELQRSLAALKGELPIDPAMERQFSKMEEDMRAELYRNLGPDYATSTPGIEAMSEFNSMKASVYDQARRGELTTAEALSLAREQQSQSSLAQLLSSSSGIVTTPLNFGVPGVPGTGPIALPSVNPFAIQTMPFPNSNAVNQGYASLQAGYSGIQNFYTGYNQAATNTAMFNAQQPSTMGQIFGAAVTLGSAALLSSEAFKEFRGEVDVDAMLANLDKLRVDRWVYKGEDKEHVGVYAEDVQELTGVGNGTTIELIDALGMTIGLIKALKSQIDDLKRERVNA